MVLEGIDGLGSPEIVPSLAVLSGPRPVAEFSSNSGQRTRIARNSTGNWVVTQPGGTSYDPHLSVAGGQAASFVTEVSKGSAEGLYTIIPESSPITRVLAGTTTQEPLPLEYTRMLAAIDTSSGAVYSIRIRQPLVGTRGLTFAPVNDRLPGITRENFFSFLSTGDFLAQEEADSVTLEVITFSTGWSKNDERLNLDVSLSDQLPSQSVRTNFAPEGQTLSVTIHSDQARGKTVRLRVRGDLPAESENIIYMLTHIYSPAGQSDKTGLVQKGPNGKKPQEMLQEELPTRFALEQNYPNPFNPSTTIAFGLDKDAYVGIEVFDLLGRLIETLKEGQMQAGYHTAVWTPENLPTGTYICRLRVTEQGGTIKTKTMGMQYVR